MSTIVIFLPVSSHFLNSSGFTMFAAKADVVNTNINASVKKTYFFIKGLLFMWIIIYQPIQTVFLKSFIPSTI
jgi:hypothetical protein